MPKGVYPRPPRVGTIQRDGYRYFLFRKKGNPDYRISEQRLVWESFNGPIPEGMVVHHKDENKLNNSIENLELMSFSDHTRMHRREGWGYEVRGVECKPCRQCTEVFPLTDFYKKGDSHHSFCKPCYNKRVVERRRAACVGS